MTRIDPAAVKRMIAERLDAQISGITIVWPGRKRSRKAEKWVNFSGPVLESDRGEGAGCDVKSFRVVLGVGVSSGILRKSHLSIDSLGSQIADIFDVVTLVDDTKGTDHYIECQRATYRGHDDDGAGEAQQLAAEVEIVGIVQRVRDSSTEIYPV